MDMAIERGENLIYVPIVNELGIFRPRVYAPFPSREKAEQYASSFDNSIEGVIKNKITINLKPDNQKEIKKISMYVFDIDERPAFPTFLISILTFLYIALAYSFYIKYRK
jgi:hypothetical protein